MTQISLFTGPDYLIKAKGTVSAHAFLATNGVIPEDGLVVSVDAPNLSEFDLAGISVKGGEIEAVRDGGFDLRMTEYTTLVNLPIAVDGETEMDETATFSLAEGEGYEIIEDYSNGTFNLVDTEADIPLGVVTEPNDITSVATDTAITPENPSFSAASSIYFDIGNRYRNPDGTYTYIDANEDVDLYQMELSAGDTIAVETFEVEGNGTDAAFGMLTGAAIFDSEGDRLSSYTEFTPAAPNKLFGGTGAFNEDGTVNENETDSYQEYTVQEDGTYYVGVSEGFSVHPRLFGREDFAYDIEVPNLGDNAAFDFLHGNYEIEIDLLTEENPRKVGTPTPPVSNPDVTNPPTLALSAKPITTDAEGNLTNAVVEHLEEFDGVSSVTFNIKAEGEIPEGGIELVLNSDANLFDYVSFLQQNTLPSTIGGQSLGAFYNEDGIPTGIRLLIEEPIMTVSLDRANPGDFLDSEISLRGNVSEPVLEQFEGLETDGAEAVNFFLQPGEGYEVAPDAGETEITYYDSLADVPPPAGGDMGPEVGVTISESTLIESEGTETTMTFTLSEPPPAEGVSVLLDSDDEVDFSSVLSQFDVLDAEIVGGDFPIANGDRSGFLFNITEQTATIALSVFDELTVPGFSPDTFQEGILDLTFALESQPGYTIDPDASEISLSILDNPDSQIRVLPTAATIDDEDNTALLESEGTVGVINLSLGARPPAEGLTVSFSTDALADFDTEAIEVAGGTLAAVRDDGFDVTLTERQATVNLPILSDGVDEGSETATFTLEPGDGYEIIQALSNVTFQLADNLGQGFSEEIEGNDVLSEANALGLSAENPTVSVSGALAASASEFPDSLFGFHEDVDLYSITLDAGQTLALDIDAGEPETSNLVFPALEDILQTTDTELRLFDADGNELAANNDGAAPDEEFSRDPYLEYTAETAGTYYVGVSQLGNDNYDPNVVRSGSGWTFPEVGVFFGDYELTASLVDDTTSPTTPVEEPSFEPVFGSLEADIIEVSGTSQLIFGGDFDDLIDASTSSTGSNRIYAGSGDDTAILGMSDRIVGGEGADKFFATSGGDNILTGGAGADQFWIATAEIPGSANIITDFTSGEDVLGIAGLGIGFDDLSITQQDDNVLIAANGSDLAILQGIGTDSLIADNFAFA